MKKLPRAKNDNIVAQQLDKELLIYDLITNQAFCLNETSFIVFNACNGETTFDELKSKHKFTDDLIFLALDELEKQNLLQKDGHYKPQFAGMSRREVVRKIGLSTMIVLPLISTVIAPQALAAQSGCQPLGLGCPPANSTQGICCDGLRCRGNTCIVCITPGGIFNSGPLATPDNCNLSQAKNLCCDTAAPATGDGADCFCGGGGGGGGGGEIAE